MFWKVAKTTIDNLSEMRRSGERRDYILTSNDLMEKSEHCLRFEMTVNDFVLCKTSDLKAEGECALPEVWAVKLNLFMQS